MAPGVDVVLGPTEDGGYYLIGMRAPRAALFEDMAWSTPTVLGRTLERAQRLGLRVACLPAWFDVDTAADLERLGSSWGGAGACPATPGRFSAPNLAGPPASNLPIMKTTPDGGGAAASRGG